MKKIIFFSPHDLPDSHISRNFDYAKRLASKGHKIVLIANNFSHRDKCIIVPRGNKYFELSIIGGVHVVWLNTPKYNHNKYMRAINAIYYLVLSIYYSHKEIDDVDYCIGDSVPPTAGFAAYFISVLKKCKFIFQVRDVWPISLVYDKAISKLGLTYFSLRLLEIFLYKNCFKIYSSLPNLKKHVIDMGVNPDKIVYLPNGVDLRVMTYSPASPVINNIYRVVYAGGFGNAHDVKSIILAANILQDKGIGIDFYFFGDGSNRSSCESLVKSLKLKNVHFKKSVDKKSLAFELKNSDILVGAVTDSAAYSFGINLNKIYDYLAVGRPIILAIKSPHKIVEDARCGFMVEPENPMQIATKIYELTQISNQERVLLGLNGRHYAERNYDVDSLADIFDINLN